MSRLYSIPLYSLLNQSALIELRTAVDHAVSGNYEIEFELQGEGELVNLARSIRNLISHARLTV